MATYSRSQSTTQTAQSTAAMPSMDISSLLVKTMENVMNDKEGGEKGFEESVTNGINNSDLLKDKTKKDTDKELADLLKDKKNTDKELSNLLKDTNKNAKESKKTSVKSESDKIVGGLGKLVTGGILGSTIKGIMGGGAKGAVSGALSGTGKVTGGLVSGVGNVGGSLIAGVGKLFGPIGGIIGKAVGAAVAVPFKAVGGLITGAIGGLAKLLSSPLKELVTKGALIVGVLSQLFVFLEGLLAKFIAQKDIKWIDFMSKLKSSISMIPDRLMLSLEELLSKVKILGKPIFGAGQGLDKEEKKELKSLQKKYDKTGINSATNQLFKHAKDSRLFTDEELEAVDLSDEESRAEFQEEWKKRVNDLRMSGDENKLNHLSGIDQELDIDKFFDKYSRAKAKVNPEDLARMAELEAKKAGGKKDFEKARKDLIAKEQALEEDYFAQGLYDLSTKQVEDEEGNIVTRGLTAEEQKLADKLHTGSTAKVVSMHSAAGTELVTKDATGAERFLNNQYKAWTDSWAKMFKDLKQDIGIDIKQKVDRPNPNISR